MIEFYLVFCSSCNKAVTGANPPGHPDFVEKVLCVVCNSVIDANVGRYHFHPIRIERENFDLLSVG